MTEHSLPGWLIGSSELASPHGSPMAILTAAIGAAEPAWYAAVSMAPKAIRARATRLQRREPRPHCHPVVMAFPPSPPVLETISWAVFAAGNRCPCVWQTTSTWHGSAGRQSPSVTRHLTHIGGRYGSV